MSWGAHPDTVTMAMVSKIASEKAGGTGTLDYLKYYRGEYELAAFGEAGTLEYIQELDDFIASWEAGKRPSTENLCVPMMGLADTKLPGQKSAFGLAIDRLRGLILSGDVIPQGSRDEAH